MNNMVDQELVRKVKNLKDDYDVLRQLEKDSACKIKAQTLQIAKLKEQQQYQFDRINLLSKQVDLLSRFVRHNFANYVVPEGSIAGAPRFIGLQLDELEKIHWDEVEKSKGSQGVPAA